MFFYNGKSNIIIFFREQKWMWVEKSNIKEKILIFYTFLNLNIGSRTQHLKTSEIVSTVFIHIDEERDINLNIM